MFCKKQKKLEIFKKLIADEVFNSDEIVTINKFLEIVCKEKMDKNLLDKTQKALKTYFNKLYIQYAIKRKKLIIRRELRFFYINNIHKDDIYLLDEEKMYKFINKHQKFISNYINNLNKKASKLKSTFNGNILLAKISIIYDISPEVIHLILSL